MTTELKTIVLPSNVTDLQSSIKKAIEHFQGSPVVNENKLRESLAASLDFKNYNQLSASIKAEEANKPVTPMNAYYSEDYKCTVIEGVNIIDVVCDEELTGYRIVDRSEEIDNIYDLLSGLLPQDSVNRNQMRDALDFLNSLTDSYVISNIWDSNFISPTNQPECFNEACLDILSENKAFIEKSISYSSASISDDDLCSECNHCLYRPGRESGCSQTLSKGQKWPAKTDADGYTNDCTYFVELTRSGKNIVA